VSTGDSINYYHYYGVLVTDLGDVSYLSNVLLTTTGIVLSG